MREIGWKLRRGQASYTFRAQTVDYSREIKLQDWRPGTIGCQTIQYLVSAPSSVASPFLDKRRQVYPTLYSLNELPMYLREEETLS